MFNYVIRRNILEKTWMYFVWAAANGSLFFWIEPKCLQKKRN